VLMLMVLLLGLLRRVGEGERVISMAALAAAEIIVVWL
jgi:hypothetical protein